MHETQLFRRRASARFGLDHACAGRKRRTQNACLFRRYRQCHHPIVRRGAHAARFTEEYDLVAGAVLSEGYISERRRTPQATKTDTLYAKLVAAAESLLALARRSRGMTNRDLTAFTAEITRLIERFR